MHFHHIITAALMAVSASADQVTWDSGYDDASRSLSKVACSDGDHGLQARFPTQGDLPKFIYPGGAAAVAGWNSPNCATCWSLQYGGRNITVLAIDHADKGFNIAKKGMDVLTNGHSDIGHIDATATLLTAKDCGL